MMRLRDFIDDEKLNSEEKFFKLREAISQSVVSNLPLKAITEEANNILSTGSQH